MPTREGKSRTKRAAEDSVEETMDGGHPFVAVVQNTRMPMVFSDPRQPGNPIIYANDAFLELTGYSREEVLGETYHFMMGADTDQAAKDQIEAAYQEGFGATYPEVLYYRKDGEPFWAVILIGPVFDGDGRIVQHFASFVDVTQRKQDEQRAHLMLDELDHRVKNTLATVQAIAAQSLSGSAVEKQVRDVFQERIQALSMGHTLLAQESWEHANLCDIARVILQPFGLEGGAQGRISVKGDDLFVKPRAAVAFAMMFQELANNAAKYGALSNDAGKVEITWRSETRPDGRRLRLTWRELGGPPVEPPTHRGFGARLLERMVGQEICGAVNLSYPPAGVVFEVEMPLPDGA